MATPPEYKILRTAADVTPEVLEDAEYIYDGWFNTDERIDWEDFIDRLAKCGSDRTPQYDFEEYDNAAIAKIRRHIRKIRDYQ